MVERSLAVIASSVLKHATYTTALRSQDIPTDNVHAPAAMRTMPAREAIRRPNGVTFSKRMSSASPAIQSGLITPATSNTDISAQQQPTQYAPWRSPSIREPGASLRKPPCVIRNANGFWHWARHRSFDPGPLIAAGRHQQEPSDNVAGACHRVIEQRGTLKCPMDQRGEQRERDPYKEIA